MLARVARIPDFDGYPGFKLSCFKSQQNRYWDTKFPVFEASR